jgi:hypothetical protein
MMELHQKLNMLKPTDNFFFHATNIAQVHTEDLQKILETFQGRLIRVKNIRSAKLWLLTPKAPCAAFLVA